MRYSLQCVRYSLQWRHNGRLKSPALRLFTQLSIQAQIKENIKALRHWSLCGEFPGDRWIPRRKSQLSGKCFHLMTSSCEVLHWTIDMYFVKYCIFENPNFTPIIKIPSWYMYLYRLYIPVSRHILQEKNIGYDYPMFCQHPTEIMWCAINSWAPKLYRLNSCPPGPNDRHFADDIFKCIFMNENV